MSKTNQAFWLTGKGLVIFCAITFASYLLFVKHAHHLVGWLPYLIILLCPLMHLFMHRGHSHHNDTDEKSNKAELTDEYKLGYVAAMQAQDKQKKPMLTEDRDEHGRE